MIWCRSNTAFVTGLGEMSAITACMPLSRKWPSPMAQPVGEAPGKLHAARRTRVAGAGAAATTMEKHSSRAAVLGRPS